MGTITRGTTYGSTETITNAKLHLLVDAATVTGIVNADVSAGAAIAASKLNLTGSGYVTTGANNAFTGDNTFTGDTSSSGGFNLTSTSLTDVLGLIYPVGIVITLGVATNPATLLGIGTWTAITGKVIVGKAAAGTFNTLDATGGAETHTLTTAELASHSHKTDGSDGGNKMIVRQGFDSHVDYASGSASNNDLAYIDGSKTGTAGSGTAHNNLQPYICKYVWQRTS